MLGISESQRRGHVRVQSDFSLGHWPSGPAPEYVHALKDFTGAIILPFLNKSLLISKTTYTSLVLSIMPMLPSCSLYTLRVAPSPAPSGGRPRGAGAPPPHACRGARLGPCAAGCSASAGPGRPLAFPPRSPSSVRATGSPERATRHKGFAPSLHSANKWSYTSTRCCAVTASATRWT